MAGGVEPSLRVGKADLIQCQRGRVSPALGKIRSCSSLARFVLAVIGKAWSRKLVARSSFVAAGEGKAGETEPSSVLGKAKPH